MMATHDLVGLISVKFHFSITYFMRIWKYKMKSYNFLSDTICVAYSEYIDRYKHSEKIFKEHKTYQNK